MKSRKIFSFIISLILVIGALVYSNNIPVYADDVAVTLAIWPTEVAVGDTVSVSVTISGETLGEYNIYLEYPTDILEYNGGSDRIEISGSGTNTFTYNLKATKEGSGKIQTSGYNLYNTEGGQLSVSHAGGNISVGDVSDDSGKIKIGNEIYTLADEYNLPAHPTDYTLSYVNYKGEDIYAYQSPNQKIKVVCLQNADWEQKWFVYNEDTESFSPYIEYSLDGVKYVIINKPDDVSIPEDLEETSLTLDNSQLTAYSDGTDSGMYLVYAINVAGDAGLYYYDTIEGSLSRYDAVKAIVDAATASDADNIETVREEATTEKVYATPLIADKVQEAEENDGLLSRQTLKNLLIMMIVLFIIMCIVVIVLVIRNGILQNQLYGDEDDEDEQEEEAVADKSINEVNVDGPSAEDESEGIKKGKNHSYDVNEDTGEILIEEAEDNNSGINVPPAEDIDPDRIEKAMQERPYGMDSAFEVVSADDAPEGEHVYVEPEPDEDNLIDPSRFEREIDSAFVDLDAESQDEGEVSVETEDDKSQETEEAHQDIDDTAEESEEESIADKPSIKVEEEPQKVALPTQDDEEDE